MKRANYNENSIHFSHIIVDKEDRGKGRGKELVHISLKYAFESLMAKQVSLSVFMNNVRANMCYQKVGFRITATNETEDEKWNSYTMECQKNAH